MMLLRLFVVKVSISVYVASTSQRVEKGSISRKKQVTVINICHLIPKDIVT